jgi:transcriptional regulator with XRE-family HTH domain
LAITRQALDLTQAQMAAMCGLATRSAWANYEKGYRVISRTAAYRLCLAIGVSTDWIYRGRLNDVGRDLAEKIQAELIKQPR